MKSDFQLSFESVINRNAPDCNILTGIYILIFFFFTHYQPSSSNVNLLHLNYFKKRFQTEAYNWEWPHTDYL